MTMTSGIPNVLGGSSAELATALNAVREELETEGLTLRNLILAQPPLDLLGWIAARPLLATADIGSEEGDMQAQAIQEENQFLLEYIHAALASAPPSEVGPLDEAACKKMIEVSETLRMQAGLYAMLSARSTTDRTFGNETADVEFRAKATWVMIRGNRYQQLEEEFYTHVLVPHDGLLQEVYGMGAAEIAAGIQRFADSQRLGHMQAFERLRAAHASFAALAHNDEKVLPEAAEGWRVANRNALADIYVDAFRAGSNNASRKSGLPEALLADLSIARGGDGSFFAEGFLRATPFRTLPARKTPLIEIDGDHYALDVCQLRDAGYRAILHNLSKRRPDAAKAIHKAQSAMCEQAFPTIFADHLRNARVHESVYYRDPATRQWVENDGLILLDDVLILLEAKSGAAATIASPATDFARHAQALTDLVLKAYRQCKRFFDYLYSGDEVPIFGRRNGRYVEVDRVRRSDYRLMIPIGLTVETFSPFSAMSKALPEVVPLQGHHAFLSISVDEILVLKRFLPTAGALAHYLQVRQAAAMKPELHLFDELDNLGAYLTRNRYDTAYHNDHAARDADLLMIDGASAVVDKYFSGAEAPSEPPPAQVMPPTVIDVLALLDRDRPPGWLRLDAHLRDYDADTRTRLGAQLQEALQVLRTQDRRRLVLGGEPPLFLWIERLDAASDDAEVRRRAAAVAVAMQSGEVVAARLNVDNRGTLASSEIVPVAVPPQGSRDRRLVEEDARGILERSKNASRLLEPKNSPGKLGRNAPCWCGSGTKYKKCHGQ